MLVAEERQLVLLEQPGHFVHIDLGRRLNRYQLLLNFIIIELLLKKAYKRIELTVKSAWSHHLSKRIEVLTGPFHIEF